MLVEEANVQKLQSKIRNDPAFFHNEVLGYEPWERQLEISRSIRDNRNTAVRSCNGAGKTFHIAHEGLRFLIAYGPDAAVINTAPVWTQVENQYWRYFRDAYAKANYRLGGKLLKTQLNFDETWFAMGLANNPDRMEAFQGWHSKNIMVIFDEASGISPKIYEAASGAMAGGSVVRFVLIGNPTQNSGPFFDAFKDPTFNKIRISAYDVPNVAQRKQIVPGLITHDWVDEMAIKYGEESDIFKVRVLGEFPKHASDTLISVDSVERAIDADRERQNEDDEIIGLDVARFGDDDSAFVYRKGNFAKILEQYNGNNTMETAGKAVRYLKEYPNAKIFIDVVGVGGGVFDRLKEQPAIRSRVFGVNSGASAREKADFINIRVESWVNVRDWLRDAVLEKHEGWYQLANPKYKITSIGKLQLESKEDMKKRGVKSPDVADALALTLSRPTEGDNLGLVWI